jgi:hypothetical protein
MLSIFYPFFCSQPAERYASRIPLAITAVACIQPKWLDTRNCCDEKGEGKFRFIRYLFEYAIILVCFKVSNHPSDFLPDPNLFFGLRETSLLKKIIAPPPCPIPKLPLPLPYERSVYASQKNRKTGIATPLLGGF